MKKIPYNYLLTSGPSTKGLGGMWRSGKEFYEYMRGDGAKLLWAFFFVLLSSGSTIVAPYLIALALDTYIAQKDVAGLFMLLVYLAIFFLITVIAGYFQGSFMGTIAQQTLYRLRDGLFKKLQDLPLAFFNQNKTGDLLSRLNNDTDKLSQFLTESVTRFIGVFLSIFGIAIFAVFINWKMTLAMLAAVVFLVVITQVLAPWVERQNKKSLDTVGNLSASLQENLSNFRVIVAYNKREYFRNLLGKMNRSTYDTALRSGTANHVFEPIYDFAGSLALVAVLGYGFYLMGQGELTIGVLVAFLSYTQRFYDPLRTLATIFGTIQLSLAAWSRIRAVLSLENYLAVAKDENKARENLKALRLELKDVSFGYNDDQAVVENVNLHFEAGKTYALVGPTGGGKSTLANLMSRLYDPLAGNVYLNGSDIRTYEPEARASLMSVILQDPILFSGTVAENIRYGNDTLAATSEKDLENMLDKEGFKEVVERFPQGLATSISQSGGGLSIGQKQLISFMRAILRKPKLLILDEATANIDTVTESILNKTLSALPADTTKVIIAHRLNTIKEADEIMFVNGHHVTGALDFHEAITLIQSSKRTS